MGGAGGQGAPPASVLVELLNVGDEGRLTVAKDRTPYRLVNTFGVTIGVKGAARRDEFVRRGYTLLDESGQPARAEPEGPLALEDHTVAQLEELAGKLEVSKAGPKAALVERIREAQAAEDGDTGDAGDAG